MAEQEEFVDEIVCEGIVPEAPQVPPINESSDAARLLDEKWSFVNPQLKSIPHFPSKLKPKENLTMLVAFLTIFSDSFWTIIVV
jgi:hypothetical protein